MKKILLTIAMTSFVAFTATGCPSPADALRNAVGGANGGGTSASGALASKSAFVAYLNCAKAKYPQAAASIDASIAGLNNITDAQWATAVSASGASWDALVKAYATLGCS
jgi:hypothetical protein